MKYPRTQCNSGLLCIAVVLGLLKLAPSGAAETIPQPMEISSGWKLQDAAKVTQVGDKISSLGFHANRWYAATVPGTVLTSLGNDGVYPEPLYGENSRTNVIPESLCRTRWWYRTELTVPKDYANLKVWLNFDGINYAAEVWVNGKNLGDIKGAFIRGVFDISSVVEPGKPAALAVLITPQPHPGDPQEQTLANGVGKNGGITAIDGPTFLCTIGWDWIPGIRDRDSGIWQKVFLSATGPVLIKDPFVTTKLPLPDLSSADVGIQVTLQNVTDKPQSGLLKGNFGDISFEQPVTLAANATNEITLTPAQVAGLHVKNPKLWWPNGFGPQNLYSLHLSFEAAGNISDQRDTTFGIRQIEYSVPDSENLTLSVNGVRVFCRGGDWGMDEAMKRIPRERLEACVRMHQIANLNMIRNWVGQSTSQDIYDLCDKYGIMLWDEFFQPNPSDGPNPTDLETYMANVRDKVLRFRSHPSVALWCARNEGNPPKEIDEFLKKVLAELDPGRRYQASSKDGGGVRSGGPYCWREPRQFYNFPAKEVFKTEIGSVSIPTLESVQGMMPKKDWEIINDDWAEHDLAGGAQKGDQFPKIIANRYGKTANLADFVRKGQLATYEAFRAMYEGRNSGLFRTATAVITWMSHPAQPSFVWQLYHYDLEPNSALFAVRKAGEPVHVQLNEKNWDVEVINNLPSPLAQARVHLTIYNLDGKIAGQQDFPVNANQEAATVLGAVNWPASLSAVHFVKLELRDAAGKLLSDNFYWRALPEQPDDLTALASLPVAELEAAVARHDAKGKCLLEVTLKNSSPVVALMAHLQLRRQQSGERVLPVYYTDNYVSLALGETKTIGIEAAAADLKADKPLVVLDGWNIGLNTKKSSSGIALNENAQVGHWPVTGLPTIPYKPVPKPAKKKQKTEGQQLKPLVFQSAAPGKFELCSPRDGDHFQVAQPLLFWGASPDAIRYEVFVDNTRIGEIPAATVSVMSYPLTKPLAEGLHHWSVKAITATGNTLESATFAFTVEASTWPDWAIGPFVRYGRNPILTPKGNGWESLNTFNPGVMYDDGKFRMLYRGQPTAQGHSQEGYAESLDGVVFDRKPEPIIAATEQFEKKYGCEDARLIEYEGKYYAFYTGDDRGKIALCEAVSTNCINWTKLGIIQSGPKNGAVVCDPFNTPIKINGKFCMYIGNGNCGVCYSDDLTHWSPSARIDLKLPQGWVKPWEPCVAVANYSKSQPDNIVLFIAGTLNGKGKWYYAISEVLFNKNNLTQKAAQLDDCIMKPAEPYESGTFQNCLWMNSIFLHDHQWWMHYGAGDRYVGLATAPEK